jgi:hypothetical protein
MSTMYCAAESLNLIAHSCRNLSVMFRDDELAYPSICGKQQLSMFMREQPLEGAAATTEKLRNAFFFPFMKKEVSEMVEACEACQMKTRRGANDQRHTYATTSREGYPFQRLSIDLVGPFPMSPEGYTHLLTVRCTFSKWLEAFPLKDEKATSVVEVLEREMFCRYGPPEGIHSNNGCQFTSCLLKEVRAELGITLNDHTRVQPQV